MFLPCCLQVLAQRHSLAAQIQDILEVRRTEPEQALLEQAQQYEVRLKSMSSRLSSLFKYL